ncbi:YidH family protein [Thermodesulfovibrio thiophilus]|uniref:YidH family protein n=1 Tax=Thermodesulfovibrio thiophilus TaxID=340095 RepID=UPI001833152B|nr:DUF202 domain-containing protein [Thermodesulfovibrio thiophilus]HHW20744.1 DUF202 domain-containing protein [Thermodesulfovibrio thiophilus]
MNEQDNIHPRVRNRRVHLANERTFLSWIRTSIGIMAFGFVVEKFALFVKQFYLILGKQPFHSSEAEYSTFFGIVLVSLGGLMGFLAFIRYKKIEKQIDEDTYQPSTLLDILLIICLLIIVVFLIVYLIRSI